MVLELRPAHEPTKAYGVVGVALSLEDLSSSIWMWYLERGNGRGGAWKVKTIIDIPAEPADLDRLPELLKGFKAVPPLVTDINLSVDDQSLYVSCWGTGELRRCDVSDPFNPALTGSLKIGGIVRRQAHPAAPAKAHGAGLMVVPLVLGDARAPVAHAHYALQASVFPSGGGALAGLDAAVIHTAGYLLVSGVVAVLVYEKLGLRLLRSAWVNLDVVWLGALIVTAVAVVIA